ncbi:MAG: putative toxin-antitoxin system toxin component, PIN family, partial [Nitrospirae bacterium]|nr:putative toxin-antitoxin system toxin component, PIN family [Nitrospirota bacterium]
MVRVVLDTNQIVSALLGPEGPSFEVLKGSGLAGKARYERVLSDEILAELRRVLSYPRVRKILGWPPRRIGIFVALLREHARIGDCRGRERIVPGDPDDDKFFRLAVRTGARYIVSRDAHLLEVHEPQSVPQSPPLGAGSRR